MTKKRQVHREMYIDHWKYALCVNDRINPNWITTNKDADVTCGNCLKVINKIDRIANPRYKKQADVPKAVRLLKRRRRV